MADSFADSVVSRFEGSKKEEAGESKAEEAKEQEGTAPGKMLAAAIRRGDAHAIEEAVCAIVDKHKY